jgi:transcriptional regulator with XRE-family HTH domain
MTRALKIKAEPMTKEAFRQAADATGLNNRELARLLGYTPSMITMMKNGQREVSPRVGVILRLYREAQKVV